MVHREFGKHGNSGDLDACMDDSLIVYDVERGFHYGVMKNNDMNCTSKCLMDENKVIVADLKNGSVKVYDNKKLVNASDSQEIIDFNANGRRWEGYVKSGKPFGYGKLYDDEGRKEYEGFMLGEMKFCFGIEYYSDIDKVKYEGGYYYNSRFGKGILYDRNGAVEYAGLWKYDNPYSPHSDGKAIDNHTKSIAIPNTVFENSECFILHSFKSTLQLEHLVIGEWCFRIGSVFSLSGLIV